jgi:hypothetical protein
MQARIIFLNIAIKKSIYATLRKPLFWQRQLYIYLAANLLFCTGKLNNMVRKRLIPESSNIVVTIPENYVGKNVEVIVFADEDMLETLQQRKNIAQFKGALSTERGIEFHEFAKEIRTEWDRAI